jgi:formylmethanofuran:tetrahydromethanopterin formyltransferase
VTVEPVSIKDWALRQLQDNLMLFYLKERSAKDILSVQDVDGVLRISAGNYGGRFGKHKISSRRGEE